MPAGDEVDSVTLVSLVDSFGVATSSPLLLLLVLSLVDSLRAFRGFGRESGQPFQRSQTGHEAVFASPYVNELR